MVTRDLELLVREQRGQVVEGDAVAHFLGLAAVDEVGLDEWEVLLAGLGWTDDTHDGVAGLQPHQLDLRLRHVDVVGRGQIVVVGRAQVTEALWHDFEHAFGTHGAVEIAQQVVAVLTWVETVFLLTFLLGLQSLFLCGWLFYGFFFLRVCFLCGDIFHAIFMGAFALLLCVFFLLTSRPWLGGSLVGNGLWCCYGFFSFGFLRFLWFGIDGELYAVVSLPFADGSLGVLADARTTAAFGLRGFCVCSFFNGFFHRLFLGLNGLFGSGRFLRLGFFGFLGFGSLLFLFFWFCVFLDVRMVYLMVNDVVNELGTVAVFIVDTHLGSNDFEVVQRLLIEFKNVVHKELVEIIPARNINW